VKIGDIVRQSGNFIKGNMKVSSALGVVIELHELPEHLKNTPNGNFLLTLGRGVTVMWENGKISESFAESSLEVISPACNKD